MVPARIQQNRNTSILTRVDHVGELVGVTAAGVEVIRDGLVIEVPLVAVSVFCGGRDLDVRVS